MSDLWLERWASIYLFHPLARLGFCRMTQGIPVLMYHSISEEPETGVRPYYRTATHPKVFNNHMQYLYEHGYAVIDLHAAITALESDKNVYRKYVVITFDDGLRDFYTNALPILKKYSFPATVFVPTGLIDTGQPLKDRPVMTWDEIQELKSQGIQIGSHTVSHMQLKDLPLEQLKYELEISKACLEAQLGESIDTFCYPYAFPEGNVEFLPTLKEILVNAGYRYATGTRIGTLKKGDDPYYIKRIPMNSCDDILLFEAKLNGGYDWLYGPQMAFKKLKQGINISDSRSKTGKGDRSNAHRGLQ
jgi:peptidoglycan/xylan/chitin deacetylase (PgdA/CDA1 family)